jgi:hypothetical protein
MCSEQASLWVVPANGGSEIAVLIKASTPSIKAIIAGCDLELLFATKENYLLSGCKIYDVPGSPLILSGAVRHKEEQTSILRLLNEKKAPIFLFNEMNICLAWSNLTVYEEDAISCYNNIDSVEQLYIGPFDDLCSHALDCFCYSIDTTQHFTNAKQIPLYSIKTNLESWRITKNHFIGMNENHLVDINDKDEGEIFERTIWASLESVFPLTLYKSPRLQIGKKQRELTDVMAHYTYGSLLIEAKDIYVLEAGYHKDIDKKTRGIQKQVKKAIKQLIGSQKALMRGDIIYDSKGTELSIERSQPPHCIVLITELIHHGDWSEVEKNLLSAIESTGAFFNILDLQELVFLLKTCSGKPELLDYNLMERTKKFIKCQSVHIRFQSTPNKANSADAKSSAAD